MKKKIKTTWDLTPLFKNDNDPTMQTRRSEIEKKCEEFVSKWKNRNDYLDNASVLREALDEYELWHKKYDGGGAEWFYFHLMGDLDLTNPTYRAKMNQVQNFKQKIDHRTRFFYLNIAKIPEKTQTKFLSSSELKLYKHFLERIFAESKYLLSESEEQIISMKSVPAYGSWVKMTASFLSKEEREILCEDGTHTIKSFSDILSLVDNPNKQIRDDAAKALNDILAKHADVATEELNAILENKRVDDELRRMERPDFSRHLSDDISSEIIDTVIETVSKNNHVAAEFYELKAKLLGVTKLQYHERNVPTGEIEKTYTFEQSVKLLMKVFSQLDPEFAQILERFVQNGHVDVYPKKGKRGGAYCAYHLITHPTYVLLNHTDKLEDVLTLAHEMGHGINDELIKTKQHALNFGTPLATAEVASTFMEDFVLQEILKKADDEVAFNIMVRKLNSDISSIFRQIACYKVEQKLHEQYRATGYLSKDDIGKIFQTYMTEYMGEYVEQSPGSENWWVYWGHIRYFFYVYSYASGLLISKSLQRLVKQDKKYILKVKEFLSAGLSATPVEIFKNAGIDITGEKFWENGMQEIKQLLEETTKLAKKLKKI